MAEAEGRTERAAAQSDRRGTDRDFEPTPPRWLRPLRDQVHRAPGGALAWKIIVGVVGAAVAGVGILLIPLPGPGWAIVFLGLAMWATEFHWAHRLLRHGRRILNEWTQWARRQSMFVRGLLGVGGLAFLAAVFYLVYRFLW